MDKELLISGLERIGVNADETAIGRFSVFVSEIMLFNPALKLVGDKDPDEIIIRHILDSAAAYPVFKEETAAGCTIADLGSGAGFPGIVLSILFPDRHFVLVERMQRRSQFLKGVLLRTGIGNAEVEERDLRTIRSAFDAVTCRAFHPVFSIAEDVARILPPGAPLLLYKGQRNNALSELSVLRGEGFSFDDRIVDLRVPYLDETRTMLVLRNLKKS